jgi:4-cresol dehydrogenase (hydroxylating)
VSDLPSLETERRLHAAGDAFAAALGEDGVVRSRAELDEFRDPYRRDPDQDRAALMVMPTSVEEVQAVVRIAGELGVPLWTFGQGRNNGYGGAAPIVPGSVLVNLRRMNRIIEVDEECGYAIVEPGVRFQDLYEHLHANGHRLWMSLPDLGWGSIVGNTLEHGIGYLNQDHPGRQCGMEVVLGDGDVVRTGMGAMSESRAWAAHKRGFGPTADGIFMQSNFGIVTKMGIWLMPEPESYVAALLKVPRVDDLTALMDTLRPLMMEGLIHNHPTVGSVFFASALLGDEAGDKWFSSSRAQWHAGPGAIPEDVVAKMAEDLDLGRWNMRFALYGRSRVVDLDLEIVREAFAAAIPGARIDARKYDGATVAQETTNMSHLVMAGIPTQQLMEKRRWYGGDAGGHLDFSVIAPLKGAEAVRRSEIARPICERYGFDYDPAMIAWPRSFVHLNSIYFDTTDKERREAAFALYDELLRASAQAGYGVYRTHIEFMDRAADTYDHNDHALRRLNERLKDALDPAGVLSPGKQGIWPAGSGSRA